MGYYGTLLLAKPATGTLPAQPEVRRAFGSHFATPSVWGNKTGLYDLGQGWQRVGVRTFATERLRLAEGVDELVATTAAPALAGYVSESSCAHLEGRTPTGGRLSLHLPNTDEPCGYRHSEGRPGRMEPRLAAAVLSSWAGEAGRTPWTETLAAVIDGTWTGSPLMEDAVLAVFTALGFPSATEIRPVVDPDDPAFDGYELDVLRADDKAGARMHAQRSGYPLEPEDDLTPQELDYLEFRDLLWSSVYGGGASREELVARYERLRARWKQR